MATSPLQSPAEIAAAAAVAIRAAGPAAGRIEAALAAGGRPLARDEDEAAVVVIAHRRPGAAACSEVRDLGAGPRPPQVILVVEEAGAVDVRRALQAGARAVVIESTLESTLDPSIAVTLAGQVAIPSEAGAKGAPRPLTTREKQILGLVVMGLTNAAIAAQLYLAESTVKSHLSSAFAKLGVASRSEAATVILDPRSAGLGILTIPSKSGT
jgi:DNA-binding NarL/FixJ family response regulator